MEGEDNQSLLQGIYCIKPRKGKLIEFSLLQEENLEKSRYSIKKSDPLPHAKLY